MFNWIATMIATVQQSGFHWNVDGNLEFLMYYIAIPSISIKSLASTCHPIRIVFHSNLLSCTLLWLQVFALAVLIGQ